MSNVQKLGVTLTASSSRKHEIGDDELLKLWQDGIASGPGRFKSIEQIKREAWRRAAKTAKIARSPGACHTH